VSSWAAFLKARAELINEGVDEGKSWNEIARWLSCDTQQVALIHHACGPDGTFTTDSRPKDCVHDFSEVHGRCLNCGAGRPCPTCGATDP